MYKDPYAHIYQKMEGFKILVLAPKNQILEGYLSFNPSTRSTYDIAMKDATIDGLLTMDQIEEIRPGYIFYREKISNEKFIIQSINKIEFQKDTKNISAIKQNCYITVQKKKYVEEENCDKFINEFEDLVAFVTMQNKDEKNFAAGIEDNTTITIQIPKRNLSKELINIELEDRIVLSNLEKDFSKEIKVESVNLFSVPGVIILYGTFDTRTGD